MNLLPQPYDELPNGRSIRAALQQACAIAHGVGSGLSANKLIEYVLEHGLPPREERERILAQRLDGSDAGIPSTGQELRHEAGDNTTQSSFPA